MWVRCMLTTWSGMFITSKRKEDDKYDNFQKKIIDTWLISRSGYCNVLKYISWSVENYAFFIQSDTICDNLTKYREWLQVLRKSGQFLLHLWLFKCKIPSLLSVERKSVGIISWRNFTTVVNKNIAKIKPTGYSLLEQENSYHTLYKINQAGDLILCL